MHFWSAAIGSTTRTSAAWSTPRLCSTVNQFPGSSQALVDAQAEAAALRRQRAGTAHPMLRFNSDFVGQYLGRFISSYLPRAPPSPVRIFYEMRQKRM